MYTGNNLKQMQASLQPNNHNKQCLTGTSGRKSSNLLYPNIVPLSQTITFEFPAILIFSAEFFITWRNEYLENEKWYYIVAKNIHLKKMKELRTHSNFSSYQNSLTEGAQNWPFLIFIILPVLAAATRRSVCYGMRWKWDDWLRL